MTPMLCKPLLWIWLEWRSLFLSNVCVALWCRFSCLSDVKVQVTCAKPALCITMCCDIYHVTDSTIPNFGSPGKYHCSIFLLDEAQILGMIQLVRSWSVDIRKQKVCNNAQRCGSWHQTLNCSTNRWLSDHRPTVYFHTNRCSNVYWSSDHRLTIYLFSTDRCSIVCFFPTDDLLSTIHPISGLLPAISWFFPHYSHPPYSTLMAPYKVYVCMLL
jgi:hypothetical protein